MTSSKHQYFQGMRDLNTVPFTSAEETWFWFVNVQSAKSDGARLRSDASAIKRPCESNDILKIVDRLYRQRRLVRDHLKVLHHYGVRMMAPDQRRIKEMRAHSLWKEALDRIEPVLIRKGIVEKNDPSFFAKPIVDKDSWAQGALLYQSECAQS